MAKLSAAKKRKLHLIVLWVSLAACVAIFFAKGISPVQVAGIVLRSGQPLRFGTYTVWVDKIQGNKLYGIKVDDAGNKYTAKSGDYVYDRPANTLQLNLYDGAGEKVDPENPGLRYAFKFNSLSLSMNIK